MKTLILIFSLLFAAPTSNIYEFKNLKDLNGKKLDLSKYKGKKVLIVNTASKCGYTKQYEELQQLSELFKNKVVVIGFPANNFKNQEPGTNKEIKDFCEQTYGVKFPMSEKVSVNGDDIHPLFKYLISAPNPDFTGDIQWNFEKFLIDENGKLIHRFRSKTTPLSKDITQYL
ncbi:glutathione peroxidase [Pseudopedobacter saltans DSM 12145]|uniref:Glutathione peroxidase n=1 Tax=Pseudopedobacter saltans (strain ATCC 51119 / DSM 12145 / JCM 21818 / CCUG 39354 / LMG 10337 / NBRC 100064 / NCIMB 13643) TaxID=762903 RepID=F0SB13_PSESL|nr:glutathione peroxidase [Pseudopedobacter saltans]ADY52648.1 glutathione peroxidase [Pseudopedobacter saltans DSM 12145]